MDYLHDRQDEIQDALAARHLAGGTLVLYDVSSAAFEPDLPAGVIGHPKTVPGPAADRLCLLTSKDARRHRGVPGYTGTPIVIARDQAQPVQITRAMLDGIAACRTPSGCANVAPAGLDWITALRAPQVKSWSAAATCS